MKFEIRKHKEKTWYRLIIECECGKIMIVPLDNIPIHEMERIFSCKLVIED